MLKHIQSCATTGLALMAMAGSGAVHAAACSATAGQASFIGGASTDDVALGGFGSDQCVVSGVNPQSGMNGDTSGFSGAFGTGWSLLNKGPGSVNVGGVNFVLTFGQTNATAGTWSVTTDRNASFDLVFAMHASNHSGAFLFDNETAIANLTDTGTWKIEWLNNGGNVPAYSNLTFFVRDVQVSAVPEPETYALMLGGLVGVWFMARRRKA